MTEPITSKSNPTTPRLCEFSTRPFDDCYCCNIIGRNVLKVATYCMESYQECPVYQKMAQQNETSTDDSKKD